MTTNKQINMNRSHREGAGELNATEAREELEKMSKDLEDLGYIKNIAGVAPCHEYDAVNIAFSNGHHQRILACEFDWSLTPENGQLPITHYRLDKPALDRMDVIARNGPTGDHYEDMVNHPPHYQSDNGIECIDAIRAALGKDGFISYCRGNVMKYLWRDKTDNLEDYKKAQWYLNRMLEEME